MPMKLHSHPDSNGTNKILVAAKYAGLDVQIPNKADNPVANGKMPVLETDRGCIFSTNAIVRYVSRINRVVGLYGQNIYEGGAIDSWVEFCTHELEVPLVALQLPARGVCPEIPEATLGATDDIAKALTILNNHLTHNTYMAGNVVSLADICLCCALADGFKDVLRAEFMKAYGSVMRWFNLCLMQPEFASVLGKVAPCNGNMSSKKEASSQKAAAPKKEATNKKEAASKKEAAPKKEAANKKDAAPKKEATPKKESAPKKEAKKPENGKAAPKEKSTEEPNQDRAKQMKKVIKEGGKRGVEIEGAADMGGLQFFCTSVDEPQGDLEMLIESVKAMNAKSDPTEEERKGGSGHIGKMVFAAGPEQLAVVAYVPDEKQGELVCEEWLAKVLSMQPGGKVVAKAKDYSTGVIPTDADKGIFPLKIREGLILEANNYLRGKGLFPEDDDDDDEEFVFGDDDFPS